MKSMKKVALGFGLVSVPVKVYKAVEANDVSMHQIHTEDCGRIRYKRVCEGCNTEVAYADISKSFELSDRIVPLTDDDLKSLPLSTSKELSVDQFVDASEIDPMLMNGQHYYLGPDVGGDRGYALMTEALASSGRVALCKAALHGRERIAAIRPSGSVLVMDMLAWPEEIRNPEEVPFKETPKVNPEEVDLAIKLIDILTAPFDPGKYTDEYAAALDALVELKMADPSAVPVATAPAAVPAAQPSMAGQLEAALKALQSEKPEAIEKPRKSKSRTGKVIK